MIILQKHLFCITQIKQHSKTFLLNPNTQKHNIHTKTALFIPFNPTHKAFIGEQNKKQ